MKLKGHPNVFVMFSKDFWLVYVPKSGAVEYYDSYSVTHEVFFKDLLTDD